MRRSPNSSVKFIRLRSYNYFFFENAGRNEHSTLLVFYKQICYYELSFPIFIIGFNGKAVLMKKDRQTKRLCCKVVAMFIGALLFLAGCQLVPTGSSSTVATSATSSAVSFPASVQPSSMVASSTKTEPPSSSMTASQLERLNNIRLIMFQAGEFGRDICAFENGSPLASGLFPDQVVWDKLRNGTKQYLYNIKYPYTDFPSSPSAFINYSDDFKSFESDYTAAGYKWGFGGWIAFSDDDYPFNYPVTHHAYAADTQPSRPDWKAAFTLLLDEKVVHDKDYDISDTPLIIIDVWRFDLDGDGVNEELVRACNEVQIPKTDQEVKPASNNTGVYNFMILFSTTLKTTVIFEESFYINKSAEEEFYTFQYENIENHGAGTTVTGVWQYDGNGDLILCPYYQYGEYWVMVPQIPIVCDADNDGKPELIVIKGTEYWSVGVYKAGLESGELLWCENTMHP